MNSKPKQIKIKLDVSEKAARYYKEQIRWEGEGGATEGKEKSPELDLPFEEGDVLKVISGVVDFEDDEVFYIVDVQKVTGE